MNARTRRLACFALAVAAPFALAGQASASGPELTVARADLEAAFNCTEGIEDAVTTPIMLVTGTGATGDQAYAIGKGAFDAYGHPVCWVNFPDFTTADIQISVEYLVYGIRKQAKIAGRDVAVFGISQGGLLPRFALTYWPDLRNKVSDLLSAAGTQHGTNIGRGCSAESPCIPAGWQQSRGSNLLGTLNSQPDETPGKTSYTTVRSLTDETVQPQGGKHPTSALDGASNILIQDVCPDRETTHIGTAVDSVTFAAFADAIEHKGPGKVSRFPADVCDHPYAPGLDEASTTAILDGSGALVGGQQAQAPKVTAEPKVKKQFRRAPEDGR